MYKIYIFSLLMIFSLRTAFCTENNDCADKNYYLTYKAFFLLYEPWELSQKLNDEKMKLSLMKTFEAYDKIILDRIQKRNFKNIDQEACDFMEDIRKKLNFDENKDTELKVKIMCSLLPFLQMISKTCVNKN